VKISSQDANKLVAVDKATGTLIAGVVMGVAGLAMLVSGLMPGKSILVIIGGILVVVAVIMLIFRKERTLVVDKTAGQLTFDQKSVIKKANYAYPVTDVVKIEFTSEFQTTTAGETHRSGVSVSGAGGSDTQTTQHTQLHVVLKDGTVLNIADGQRQMSVMAVLSKVPNMAVGQQIASFLGVPFEQQGPASVGDVIGQVRDAITGAGTAAPSVVPAAPAAPAPAASSAPVESETPPPPPAQPPAA